MYVRHLQVSDFRSWEHADLEFTPGANVLLGQNGQGKTNLIEAIGYTATLGSHRVAVDLPLIRHGCPRAIVRTAVVNAGRELTIELEITAGKANRARVNRSPVSKTRDVLGILRTVLFAPEDLALVRGDPSERRRFLDELLVLRTPRYAGVRADYDRVLRQRNALLKSSAHARRAGSKGDIGTLDVWDGHLARHGAELLAARLDLVADLAGHVTDAYAGVAPESRPAWISYRSGIAGSFPEEYGTSISARADIEVLTDALLAAMAAVRDNELERGVSLVGPHRDEVVLMVGGMPARTHGSQGEQRSFALALRLAAHAVVTATVGEAPVLLLDDVFSELDETRAAALVAHLPSRQTVLTTAGRIPPGVTVDLVMHVTAGRVT